ncbi:hypothetical protein JTB14_021807 [Gonioctena quinquepunctata]|nr:hypothetical protein JTB14_021807 [Gonioctena quinquepunctata]
MMALEITESNIENLGKLTSVVKNAEQLGMDKNTKGRYIYQSIWWTKKIATFWAECNCFRRRLIRARSRQAQPESIEQLEIEYKNNRKEQWNLLYDRLDEDPWQQGYKIVVGGYEIMVGGYKIVVGGYKIVVGGYKIVVRWAQDSGRWAKTR